MGCFQMKSTHCFNELFSMKRVFFFILLLSVSYGSIAQTLALTHVTIVDVETGKAIPDQTIIIDSNRITALGKTGKLKTPASATIIDATGKYIMPGLIDAHIHFFQSGGLYTRPDALNLNVALPYEKDQQWIKENLNDLMRRYLACGITSVIDVGGPMSNYAVREQLEQSKYAPNAWVTGPLISTYQPPNLDKKDPPIIKVSSAEEARDLVKKQLPYKPDFIKIWYIVLPGQPAEKTLPIIEAAIQESHANGLKVAVHATEYLTAKLAVTAGADILVHSVDDQLVDDAFIQLLKAKNTVYIPTLQVAQLYNRVFSQNFDFTNYELSMSNPFMLGSLYDLKHLNPTNIKFDYKKLAGRLPAPSKEDSTMLTNLGLLNKAGIRIVSGTDAGNIGTQHAASLYRELELMHQGGMSNGDILKASTIQAAKGFGKDSLYGSIKKGKIANLLLLNSNPLDSLIALQQIGTLIYKGTLYSPDTLIQKTPAAIVQEQLNAYNARNIDAFAATYSDSVELYEFPNKLIAKGKKALYDDYKGMFNSVKNLHCEVTERIIQGNRIIDHESVTGFGAKPLRAVAIYEVEKGKIARVYFIQ